MTDTTARTQESCTIAIDTPLGTDELLIMEMHGTETLGRMFSFELDLIHEGSKGVDFTKILGQNVSIRLSMYNNKTRYFNGYISKFTLIGVDVSKKDHKKVYQYRATMVPLLWFLTRSADCRIFQAKKVMDIVKDILKGPAIDIEDKTTGISIKPGITAFNTASRISISFRACSKMRAFTTTLRTSTENTRWSSAMIHPSISPPMVTTTSILTSPIFHPRPMPTYGAGCRATRSRPINTPSRTTTLKTRRPISCRR